MGIIMRLKRKLGFIVSHNKFIFGIARKINFLIFHRDKRQTDKSFGPLNPDLRFYVIRSSGNDEGLLSMYLNTAKKIPGLLQEGFVPFVDWQNSKTQYNVKFPVNGTLNAWEYYFEQPCSYTLDEVCHSRNVRLSGWTLFNHGRNIQTEATYSMIEAVPVKKYIRDIADEKIRSFGIGSMIGVLARGTDYTRLRPANHPIAPSQEMISAKVDDFLRQYGSRKIFLATEDAGIYSYFVAKYGELVFTTDNNLISNYSGKDYVANEIGADDKYRFGLDYLVKMLCLSRCKYLVAADTSGSRFARLMNKGQYDGEYVFSIGTY